MTNKTHQKHRSKKDEEEFNLSRVRNNEPKRAKNNLHKIANNYDIDSLLDADNEDLYDTDY